MSDRDPLDSTVVGHLLSMTKQHGQYLMNISNDISQIKEGMKDMVSNEDLRRHSKSPTAHGFVIGLTRKQWATIIGALTALSGAGTAIASYFVK